MSFYRVYRPKVIDELDNERVRTTLLSLLAKDKSRLPHAFLFTGSRGTGKTTAARLVAKMLTCEKPSKTSGPCGVCESCTLIAEGRHMDVLEIDAASNRGIDEIRALRDGIALAPVTGDYKIYIIDEVHMLTTEAFNALLKTLEEPPSHAFFVLATTDPQKLPKTILSRCLRINFSRATPDELKNALKRITKKEKIAIDEESLAMIAKTADGSFRDAVKLLEQVSFLKDPSPDTVADTLSVASERSVDEFLLTLTTRDMKMSMDFIKVLVDAGGDMKAFVTEILGNLEERLVLYAHGTYGNTIPIGDVKDLIGRFTGVYAEMKTVAIPQLPLELAVVEFCESAKNINPVKDMIQQESDVKRAAPVRDNTQASKVKTEKHVKEVNNVTSRSIPQPAYTGTLTAEHLTEYWKEVIEECKPINHSIAGVLRSARPRGVDHGIVTLEAFYKFHQEKLSETKTKEMLTGVFKKLFGETVKVEVVLGKK